MIQIVLLFYNVLQTKFLFLRTTFGCDYDGDLKLKQTVGKV